MTLDQTVTGAQVPLCVDLDGTLVKTDLLYESLLKAVKEKPFTLFMSVLWLLRGKAYLKHQLAHLAEINCSSLPYNEKVKDFVRTAYEAKRPTYLVTATNIQLATQISEDQKYFSGVMGSTSDCNLKGKKKAEHLIEKFGRGGFDYIGDSRADLAVFREARQAYLVTDDEGEATRLNMSNVQPIVFENVKSPKTYLKAMRIHQWVKNFLIFLPLILSHSYGQIGLAQQSLLAFFSFGLCASGVYLVNDLFDLENDRSHRSKKYRPIPAGLISIPSAILMALVFFGMSFALAISFLPLPFLAVLTIYFVTTMTYSLYLKEILVIDVVCLAFLYTIRIIAGHAVTGLPTSKWLLTFSVFIFLSLAFIKRVTELSVLKNRNKHSVDGRAYNIDDISTVRSLGITSGLISVLVFALYLDSEMAKSLYTNTYYLLLIIPVMLFWISRAWTLAGRGEIVDDPVVWAIKDRTSHFVLAIILLLFVLAQMH